MTPPVVILPPSAALGIEARSKVERQALFHVAGAGLWARNGAVVRIPTTLGNLILALAGARGRTLAYGVAIDAVHGDDPEGGPLDPIGSFNVMRSRASDDFAALGIEVGVWSGFGYVLRVRQVRNRRLRHADPGPVTHRQHWLPRARIMREHGASYAAIAKTVGRSHNAVRCALTGNVTGPRAKVKKSTRTVEAMRRMKLRSEARAQAAVTGELPEQIYARWGCEVVDRSLLWDQRRAAASEARP